MTANRQSLAKGLKKEGGVKAPKDGCVLVCLRLATRPLGKVELSTHVGRGRTLWRVAYHRALGRPTEWGPLAESATSHRPTCATASNALLSKKYVVECKSCHAIRPNPLEEGCVGQELQTGYAPSSYKGSGWRYVLLATACKHVSLTTTSSLRAH